MKEIPATRLAQAPGAVVDTVLAEGPTWLTRSGRPVLALVPRDRYELQEYERDTLRDYLRRLAFVITGDMPDRALPIADLVQLAEALLDTAATVTDRAARPAATTAKEA